MAGLCAFETFWIDVSKSTFSGRSRDLGGGCRSCRDSALFLENHPGINGRARRAARRWDRLTIAAITAAGRERVRRADVRNWRGRLKPASSKVRRGP